jgi:hypothetical protein
MQCPKEGCNGEEAAFFQVQIRSADEPMTGFYKVRLYFGNRGGRVLMRIVYDLWNSLERELRRDWVDLCSEERWAMVLLFDCDLAGRIVILWRFPCFCKIHCHKRQTSISEFKR